MQRLHVSLPPWMLDRLRAIAEDDGRTVAELLRRLILNHLRAVDPESRLPNASRLASWKRASKSLEGTTRKRKRRK
jgi:predicted DNA-binding protein